MKFVGPPVLVIRQSIRKRSPQIDMPDVRKRVLHRQRLHHVIELIHFFSSRTRHTRCLSDWSSDVCSSDLFTAGGYDAVAFIRRYHDRITNLHRSEDRRVGKEGRSRWSPYHERAS